MDLNIIWEYIKGIIQPLDVLSIVVTFFITQRVKVCVKEVLRPVVAIFVGFAISASWALKYGGWESVPAYGFMYGAGAIALYMLNFDKLIKKLPGGEKVLG